MEDLIEPWLDAVGGELARAAATACAVIDFEAVLVNGAFPVGIREALVARIRARLGEVDMRGLVVPRIEAGSIGDDARALGAACNPILALFLINTHARLTPA